jgi:hypothetical protein
MLKASTPSDDATLPPVVPMMVEVGVPGALLDDDELQRPTERRTNAQPTNRSAEGI